MALTTPSYIKPFLDVNVADTTLDGALTAWIGEVSAFVRRYCNQPIESEIRTAEPFDGNGRERRTMPGFPVSDVTDLQYRTYGLGTGAVWEGIDDDAWEFVDSDGYYLYYPSRFLRGVQNYRITYTVGYEAIPEDILQVCREMVAEIYLQSMPGGRRFGMASIAKGDSPHTITETFLDLKPHWRGLLKPYRRLTL